MFEMQDRMPLDPQTFHTAEVASQAAPQLSRKLHHSRLAITIALQLNFFDKYSVARLRHTSRTFFEWSEMCDQPFNRVSCTLYNPGRPVTYVYYCVDPEGYNCAQQVTSFLHARCPVSMFDTTPLPDVCSLAQFQAWPGSKVLATQPPFMTAMRAPAARLEVRELTPSLKTYHAQLVVRTAEEAWNFLAKARPNYAAPELSVLTDPKLGNLVAVPGEGTNPLVGTHPDHDTKSLAEILRALNLPNSAPTDLTQPLLPHPGPSAFGYLPEWPAPFSAIVNRPANTAPPPPQRVQPATTQPAQKPEPIEQPKQRIPNSSPLDLSHVLASLEGIINDSTKTQPQKRHAAHRVYRTVEPALETYHIVQALPNVPQAKRKFHANRAVTSWKVVQKIHGSNPNTVDVGTFRDDKYPINEPAYAYSCDGDIFYHIS